MSHSKFWNKCPELPPEQDNEWILEQDPVDKIVKPELPFPAPEEPGSDTSFEEVDMRI